VSGSGATFWEHVQAGGPVLWLLLALALAAAALAVERLAALRRAGIDTAGFLARVRRALLVDGSVRDAVRICEERPGPVPAAVKAGLLKLGQPREDVAAAAEAAAQAEAARLERGLWALAAIARVAPLLGLLAAALALLGSLDGTARGGLTNGRAGGLADALFAAACGLAVAIPLEIAYNYLLGRVQKTTRDLQIARGSLGETVAEMERGGTAGERRGVPPPAGSGPR
jgi:biopolymer transport protein ExbB